MGVPRFYYWISRKYPEIIKKLKKGEFANPVDNLCIDLNGFYHPVAQKVYRYGDKHKLRPHEKRIPWYKMTRKCYVEIWKAIMSMAVVSQVKKRIVLCVDGVAPHSKIVQQRQRRFKNSVVPKDQFNSNNITPGTMWMHNLSNYIEHKIREEMNDPRSLLHTLEVIFSSEKVPGEGEHKIMSFIRGNTAGESYYVVGLDADLIMLCMSTHIPNIYILRDALFDVEWVYHVVNIDIVRKCLVKELSPEGNIVVNSDPFIDDFVFFCFLVGNDFLPHSPSLEIIEDGIEIIIGNYREIIASEGYITRMRRGNLCFNKKNLKTLLQMVGKTEKDLLESKIKSKKYFNDSLLEEFTISFVDEDDANGFDVAVRFEDYKLAYYKEKFPTSTKVVCHEYLKGLQWVIEYYKKGATAWMWKYPYYYAPFASDVAKHIDSFRYVEFPQDQPLPMYKQLMCVIPGTSRDLLPKELRGIFEMEELIDFYPCEYEIDLSGKLREWEGIVLLPSVDLSKFQVVDPLLEQLPRHIVKRSVYVKEKTFKFSPRVTYLYKSYYGEIPRCHVSSTMFREEGISKVAEIRRRQGR